MRREVTTRPLTKKEMSERKFSPMMVSIFEVAQEDDCDPKWVEFSTPGAVGVEMLCPECKGHRIICIDMGPTVPETHRLVSNDCRRTITVDPNGGS